MGFLPNLLGGGWLLRWRCSINWRFDIASSLGFNNFTVEDDLSCNYLLGFSEKVRLFE